MIVIGEAMIKSAELIRNYLPKKIQHTWVEKLLGFLLARLIKQKELNEIIADYSHKKGFDFVDSILDEFKFTYQVSAKDKEAIPVDGRCIIVANHPLGALDGIAILHLILTVRPDVKIVANHLLENLGSLDEYLLPINNLSGETSPKKMVAISKALKNQEAVIIFPAGEVSRTKWFKIRDKSWGRGFYLFAKRTNSKIVPLFVRGKNSLLFYLTAKFSSFLSMLLLPRQIWRQKNKIITLKVGNPIEFSMLQKLPISEKDKIKMLKKHTYKLNKNQSLFSVPAAIAHPERRSDLRLEISAGQVLGEDAKGELIVLCQAKQNSALLREVGRLREISFRQVGEGSGTKRDLDIYDTYYEHIIIWNSQDLQIAGAYRIFDMSKNYKNQDDKKSLVPEKNYAKIYTKSLFKFEGDLLWLESALELGRSFVQPFYWSSRSLDNLWQGIGAYCAKNPHIRYLFGTVSISANYPKEAVDYLVAFFGHYYKNPNFSVRSLNPYVLTQAKSKEFEQLFADKCEKTAYKEMRQFLRKHNLIVPTLFKHYADISTKEGVIFTDFGIDTSFSDCIDAFVIIDLHHIKKNKYKRYIEPFKASCNSVQEADQSQDQNKQESNDLKCA